MTFDPDGDEGLEAALFEIARVRYAAFHARFGRDPEPHEPLLFDPDQDNPTPATFSERMLQIVAAAKAVNVDASVVLQLLGFGPMQ